MKENSINKLSMPEQNDDDFKRNQMILIGKKIKYFREQKDVTTYQVAKILDLDPKTIKNHEKGKGRIDILCKLLQYYEQEITLPL